MKTSPLILCLVHRMHLKAFRKKAELDVTEAFKHKQIHVIIN